MWKRIFRREKDFGNETGAVKPPFLICITDEPKSGLAGDLDDCYKIFKKQDETFFISCASNK